MKTLLVLSWILVQWTLVHGFASIKMNRSRVRNIEGSSLKVSKREEDTRIGRRSFLGAAGLALCWTAGPFPTLAAKPPSPKLAEARDQLDLVVQACSVQAWGDAYDLVSDPILDEVQYVLPAQETSAMVTNGIQTLRQKLKGASSLPTQEAIVVMGIGTQTRSAMEMVLAASKQ